MNRSPQQYPKPFLPLVLAEAGSLSERAARAMRPNGADHPLAKLSVCNVITLQNPIQATNEGAAFEKRSGAGKAARRIGTGDVRRTSEREAADEC